MCNVILVLFLGVLAFGGSYGDKYSWGSCPKVDPLPRFNMNNFLGLWYAVQKTSTSSPCLKYSIVQNQSKPTSYQITQIRQHTPLWMSSLYHEDHTTGNLTVPDLNVPARMELDLPYDIGTTIYTVFMTDYTNYAAVLTCKNFKLAHKWSAEILSRTPKLNIDFVDQVRTRLGSYNIDPFSLSIIKQKDCAEPGAKGSIIKTVSGFFDENKGTVGDESAEATTSSFYTDD